MNTFKVLFPHSALCASQALSRVPVGLSQCVDEVNCSTIGRVKAYVRQDEDRNAEEGIGTNTQRQKLDVSIIYG